MNNFSLLLFSSTSTSHQNLNLYTALHCTSNLYNKISYCFTICEISETSLSLFNVQNIQRIHSICLCFLLRRFSLYFNKHIVFFEDVVFSFYLYFAMMDWFIDWKKSNKQKPTTLEAVNNIDLCLCMSAQCSMYVKLKYSIVWFRFVILLICGVRTSQTEMVNWTSSVLLHECGA